MIDFTPKIYLRDLTYNALHRGGLFRLMSKREQHRCVILTYHHVSDEGKTTSKSKVRTDFEIGVPKSRFEVQIKYLSENYAVVSLAEMMKQILQDRMPQRPTAAITFDDGYMDCHVNAFPVLRKYNVPATVFVATDFAGTKRRFWWDVIFDLFRRKQRLPISTIEGEFSRDLVQLLASCGAASDEEIYCLNRKLQLLIRKGLRGEIIRALKRLGVSDEADGVDADNIVMNWDQIREMADWGIEFGAHTMSHPILTELPPDEVERELAGSKQVLEERLGREVGGFAYPNGGHNASIQAIVQKIGFQYAVSSDQGWVGPAANRFALKRISVGNWPVEMMAARLCGMSGIPAAVRQMTKRWQQRLVLDNSLEPRRAA